MNAKMLELLYQWLIQDKIHDAIWIAYLNVKKFAQLITLSKSEMNLYSFIYIDNFYLKAKQKYAEINSVINFNSLISKND